MEIETHWNSIEEVPELHLNAKIAAYIDMLRDLSHAASVKSGWWHYRYGVAKKKLNFGERIALMHSELSEALEGARKALPSDHLPGFSMIEEEFADLLIRVFDTAGAMQLRLGDAYVAKTKFNAEREDHKPENRAKEGGKKF